MDEPKQSQPNVEVVPSAARAPVSLRLTAILLGAVFGMAIAVWELARSPLMDALGTALIFGTVGVASGLVALGAAQVWRSREVLRFARSKYRITRVVGLGMAYHVDEIPIRLEGVGDALPAEASGTAKVRYLPLRATSSAAIELTVATRASQRARTAPFPEFYASTLRDPREPLLGFRAAEIRQALRDACPREEAYVASSAGVIRLAVHRRGTVRPMIEVAARAFERVLVALLDVDERDPYRSAGAVALDGNEACDDEIRARFDRGISIEDEGSSPAREFHRRLSCWRRGRELERSPAGRRDPYETFKPVAKIAIWLLSFPAIIAVGRQLMLWEHSRSHRPTPPASSATPPRSGTGDTPSYLEHADTWLALIRQAANCTDCRIAYLDIHDDRLSFVASSSSSSADYRTYLVEPENTGSTPFEGRIEGAFFDPAGEVDFQRVGRIIAASELRDGSADFATFEVENRSNGGRCISFGIRTAGSLAYYSAKAGMHCTGTTAFEGN